MAKGRKTGGRVKGTPNKENPLKGYLRTHSEQYFSKRLQIDVVTGSAREIQRSRLIEDAEGNVRKIIDSIPLTDSNGFPLNLSDFEADMLALDASDRVAAELRLLKFHLPEMKAIDVDMTVNESTKTIEERLAELAEEPEEE